MKLYVLDDNGRVVFEYDEDSGVLRHGEYKVRQTDLLQVEVVKLVRTALLYLIRNLVVRDE